MVKASWNRSFGIVVLVLFFLTSCSIFKPSLKAEAVNPVAAAPEIGLPDQNGNNFQLSKMRGKVVLIFFGFTNCVDECPLTMAHIKLAMDSLGERAQNVQVAFVSTDPVRDTPEVMKEYLAKFNPTFLGITGSLVNLQKIWDAYGVEVLDGGETHSNYTYVIDQKGDLRLTFDPDMSPEDITADLESLLDAQ